MVVRTRAAAAACLAVSVLTIAACSGGDDDTAATSTTLPPVSTSAVVDPEASAADGTLRIGALVPLTGTQGDLGPVLEAAAQLAVDDLNAAGGVFGRPVELVVGDSADASTDTAGAEVDRFAAANVDAIVGPPSSGVARLVSDKVARAGAVLVSPGNPPASVPDDIPYLQTAPGLELLGKAVADQVAEGPEGPVTVFYREDDFGERLSSAIAEPLTDAGVTATLQGYNPEAEVWDDDVAAVLATSPTQIVLVGYAETATMVGAMIEQGVTPAQLPTWVATDRLEDAVFARVPSPPALAGLTGVRPDDLLPAALADRLEEATGTAPDDVRFAAQTYDAVVLVALAAARAGRDVPDAIVEAAPSVTSDGAPRCSEVADCLVAAERDPVDFVGAGGRYHLGPDGRPRVGAFEVVAFGPSGTLDTDAARAVTAQLRS